ncbi:unnamed protein product [Albugo candida]|uniref:Elicitin-like protein n=1 Tax=Albugo candida TaxID=65357 RepID=A0A024GKN8_9STRA|nr:unnamed protein product [Albugo candida]|eukprot:CCI47333.1 unnamed protein product [Albugo candida]
MKTTTFSVLSTTLALYAAGQNIPTNMSTTNAPSSNMNTLSTMNNNPSDNMPNTMSNNNMRPMADNDMKNPSTDSMSGGAPMCNSMLTTMGINQLTDGKLLSSCSGGIPMSVNNVSDATKLSAEDLKKICSSSVCMKPFSKMASSADYKDCVAMYDGKLQNLGEQAKRFVTVCENGGKDEKVSGSTDGSSEAGLKGDGTNSVVKDVKSNAVYHSFSAACVAVSLFVLALQ